MENILISTSSFGKHDPSPIKIIENAGYKIEMNPYGRKMSESEIFQLMERIQPVGIIAGIEPLTKKVLENSIKLKVISRCGIGLDSVDLQASEALDIVVKNTPDAPTVPVAELTIGMILSILRKLHLSDGSIRKNRWERPIGNLLYGKTVGIIGCGRIGSYVAKLLVAFGCKIMGYDPACQQNDYIRYVELCDLLSEADIVSLHLPYQKSTHHFVNSDRLNSMKKGSILINTARGGLVDESALQTVLKSGHIYGAALDCFEDEPYTGPLVNYENVLLTAHIGSYAKEGRILMENQAAIHLINELENRR